MSTMQTDVGLVLMAATIEGRKETEGADGVAGRSKNFGSVGPEYRSGPTSGLFFTFR